ncbi:MAG: hypothetical protein Q9172_001970, partial [Xanthocarpia lactea]
LILLRVLAFELHLPSPLQYLQRYLERAMEDVENVGEAFNEWDRDAKDEYGVQSGIMEGRLGSKCKQRAVDAEGRCKTYELASLFPTRAVALAIVYVIMEDNGLTIMKDIPEWVKDVGSGKVDSEDFEEVTEILRKT